MTICVLQKQLNQAEAREMFLRFRPKSYPTKTEIMSVFKTWDPTVTGKVSWDEIMKPVGDGKDVAPNGFEPAILDTLNSIMRNAGEPETGAGKQFSYEKFAEIMEQTMGMQAGKDKAPIKFESELMKLNLD